MFNRRKINIKDIFECSNNCYPKLKLFIKLNFKKFLDTKLSCVSDIYNTIPIKYQPNCPLLGLIIYLNIVNATALLGIYSNQKKKKLIDFSGIVRDLQ